MPSPNANSGATVGTASSTPATGPRPQGFRPLTDAQVADEARLANLNDRGDENVEIDVLRLRQPRLLGYTVSEEVQNNPFAANNNSLQSVQFYNRRQSTDGLARREPVDEAKLISLRDGSYNVLTGTSDGKVTITSLREGAGATVDITQAAAAAGITAAGIRRTQQDIAADGEVSRPEQTTIINMVNTAKGLAGMR